MHRRTIPLHTLPALVLAACNTGVDKSEPVIPFQPRCGSLAKICGPDGTSDCCETAPVPGGTFKRSYDGTNLFHDDTHPATVSPFTLDKYEVTVGRFRAFVQSGQGTKKSPPAAGAGAHPRVDGSGWDPHWNVHLPADTAALREMLHCDSSSPTWTDAPGDEENVPMNCLTWYMAFAFCAADGGYLPTEAEWNFAAAGGDEQRVYPWSNPPLSQRIDGRYCNFNFVEQPRTLRRVGMTPMGNGKWGHADLAGNVWEWTLDTFAPYRDPCVDCATLGFDGLERVTRGGGYADVGDDIKTARRTASDTDFRHNYAVGVRCARVP